MSPALTGRAGCSSWAESLRISSKGLQQRGLIIHERSGIEGTLQNWTNQRGVAIESKYGDGRWRRSAGRTLAASPWRGVVATRTELDLEEPETAAVPTAMLAWLIDA